MDQAAEAAPSLPETETEVTPEEVCRKYRKMSRFRPPFCYEAATPEYPEADESRLYAMEQRSFSLDSYPEPCEQLQEIYEGLKKRHADLEETIVSIKSLDGLHAEQSELEAPRTKVRAVLDLAPAPRNDPSQIAELFEIEKKHWENHYKCKKLFFHQALAYLYLMEAYHPEESQQTYCRGLSREASTMFIGHQATTYSRSASHELGPVRRNKQATIKHPYTVAVHGFNFILDKIEEARRQGDEKLEEALFYELKRGLMRDLFHDTLEDHYLTKSDLGCKLIEMLNFDLRIKTRMRQADDGEKKIPENINFADINRASIVNELWALKEEDSDKDAAPDQPYYLERKLPQIPKSRRSHVYLSKIRDRWNNLQSPKYKKKGKTLIKLHETLKIISLGMKVLKESPNTRQKSVITAQDIRSQMAGLVGVCLNELEKYRNSNEFRDLVLQTESWGIYMKTTLDNFSRYQEALTAT